MKEERNFGKQPSDNAKTQGNLGLINIKEMIQPVLKYITKSRLFAVSVIVGSLIIWSYATSLGLVTDVSTFVSNPMLAAAAIVALGFLLLGFILVLCAPMMVYMFLSSLMQANAITKNHAVCFCYWAISGLLLISLGFLDCIQYTEGFLIFC